MRLFRATVGAAIAFTVGGCGYVHFGRLPAGAVSDAKLAAAYADLSTEQKMLKQELALARKEGDALRVALERTGAGASDTSDLVARLNASSQELASLRAKTSELERARAAAAEATVNPAKAGSATPEQAQLQAENTQLRTELERARAENAELSARLARSQTELAQLSADLRAQKAARMQLETTLAQRETPPPAPASGIMAALQFAKAPPADSSPTVLRSNAASTTRVHLVQPGDTPENIALRYYGSAERWTQILEANPALLSPGAPLRPGLELRIPEN